MRSCRPVRSERLLRYVNDSGSSVTARDAAMRLGMSPWEAGQIMSRLYRRGLLERDVTRDHNNVRYYYPLGGIA